MKSAMHDGRIAVSYAGVHLAFRMALAAYEMGELKSFYCTLHDAPGAWGPRLRGLVGNGWMEGRDVALPADRVQEFPWPLAAKAIRDRIYPRGINHWLAVNAWFDRWAAARLRADPPELFVGVSTSDLHSLAAARRGGAALLHEVPHLHPHTEAALHAEARERAGLAPAPPRRSWRRDMADRKLAEIDLADRLIAYSEFHRDTYVRAGVAPERIAIAPLGVEPELWGRDAPYATDSDRPLRLLYVGAISLRKGVPFLLAAAARCGKAVELTIIGSNEGQSQAMLRNLPPNVRVLPPRPFCELRRVYQAHDLFVLASVGDAFGSVAMQAMACGMPVVVSANCGAAVPVDDWAVPAMDAEALAARILHYVDDRTRLAADGALALVHAAEFTDDRYRAALRREYAEMLRSK